MLRKLAKAEEDARVARRLLAIANALDGMDREAAAQGASMDRQTLRDWVIERKHSQRYFSRQVRHNPLQPPAPFLELLLPLPRRSTSKLDAIHPGQFSW